MRIKSLESAVRREGHSLVMKFCSVSPKLQRLKMLRAEFLARVLAVFCFLAVVTMLTPPVRNALIPMWPGIWRDLSTVQIIRMSLATMTSDDMAALSPCTEPDLAENISNAAVNIDIHHLANGFIRQYEQAEKWLNSSPERKARLSPFAPHISRLEKARVLETWQVLHEALRRHDIPYYMIGGSLLGAFRHKGMIPWDDDMDIAVHVRDKATLQKVLSCIPGYTLRTQVDLQWKFFADNASIVTSVEPYVKTLHAKRLPENQKSVTTLQYEPGVTVVMRYPFVDIFMMTDDGARLTWALIGYALSTTAYLLDDVYPLAFVPFESFVAPVPRNSRQLLRMLHDTDQCMSSAHNHKHGLGISNYTTVSCTELADMYPIYIV